MKRYKSTWQNSAVNSLPFTCSRGIIRPAFLIITHQYEKR
jgi:hypothetical protein